ncbi:Uncharacterised protein [Shigella sonnei]|nr:Uncharacterised protein [Shigella sonnei]
MHHRATREIQRTVRSQQTTAPHHMRNRNVRERQPYHHENQHS